MNFSEQILEAIQTNEFDKVGNLLESAIKNDPPEILASLAEELAAMGFSNYAIEIYRALIGAFPREDLFKVYLAELFLNNDQTDQALTLLFDVKKDSDAYLDSLMIQADYYQSEGLNEVAKAKIQEAFQLSPDEPVIWFALAELDYSTGNFTQALQLYQKLIDADIFELSGVVINKRLANTLANLGEYEEAAEVLRSESLNDVDLDAQYDAGLIFLQAGDNNEAIDSFKRVLAEQPDYVNAYPNLAKAYQNLNDNENVLQTAQVGLSYNEFDETLYEMGAKAAANLADLTTAQKLLERGLGINHDNQILRLSLSNLYLAQGEDEKNISLFDEVSDEEIEDQAHWNLAVSYDHLDQITQAKDEFLLAYRSFQDNTDFLNQLIIFFRENAEYDLLVLALKKYLEIIPDDFEKQEELDSLS